MSAQCMRDLAARHGLDDDELVEAWGERAAIREYLAGFGRHAADRVSGTRVLLEETA